MLIDDPPSRALHQLGVRDGVDHRLWFICFVVQFFPEAVQPTPSDPSTRCLQKLSPSTPEAPSSALASTHAQQDVCPVHLVIQMIETEVRFALRFSIQFDLKFPNLMRRFQTFASHRVFSSTQTHQKQGSFPPPELPGFIGTSDPLRRPNGPPPFDDVRHPSDHSGPPPLTLNAFLTCCAHYPGGPSVPDGYRFSAIPGRVIPDLCGLPLSRAGSASTLQLSGPAEASYSLRPARLLAHLSVEFSREVSTSTVTSAHRSPAIESNHQLFEWVLPPLVFSPFGAHTRSPAPQIRAAIEQFRTVSKDFRGLRRK